MIIYIINKNVNNNNNSEEVRVLIAKFYSLHDYFIYFIYLQKNGVCYLLNKLVD